jgi:hypothetical protein
MRVRGFKNKRAVKNGYKKEQEFTVILSFVMIVILTGRL